MDKIIIVGDVHGRFGYLNRLINKRKPDVIIACGDFGFWPRQIDLDTTIKAHNTKIYFCDGNHEDHQVLSLLNKEQEPVEVTKNVFYMPRGTALELDNKTFLFVGGALSIDKHLRIRNKDWFEEELLTKEDFDRLPDIKVDVIISHTAPNFILNEYDLCTIHNIGKMEDSSCIILDWVYKKYKPNLWYFGHFHKNFNEKFNKCHFFSLDMTPDDGWWKYFQQQDLDGYED